MRKRAHTVRDLIMVDGSCITSEGCQLSQLGIIRIPRNVRQKKYSLLSVSSPVKVDVRHLVVVLMELHRLYRVLKKYLFGISISQ